MQDVTKAGDGVRFETGIGSVVADATSADADLAVCTHAHGDHLPGANAGPTICSPLTATLAGVRRTDELQPADHPAVDLLPSGHVAGSRAALIDDGDTRYLFTGDVCTRDRCYLEGFNPPDADVLVVEATYGTPEYVLPPHEEIERSILEWLNADLDRPVICYGYSLGRAQKLQHLIEQSDRSRCVVSEAIAAVNEPIEAALSLDFGAERYDDLGESDASTESEASTEPDASAEPAIGPGDALVLPSNAASADWVADLVERTGALQAGFSGWAVDRGYRFRRGLDAAFPLSDHCDFEELLDLVAAVDPDSVYTQHGFADELAGALGLRGYDAQSLEGSQTALSQF